MFKHCAKAYFFYFPENIEITVMGRMKGSFLLKMFLGTVPHRLRKRA